MPFQKITLGNEEDHDDREADQRGSGDGFRRIAVVRVPPASSAPAGQATSTSLTTSPEWRTRQRPHLSRLRRASVQLWIERSVRRFANDSARHDDGEVASLRVIDGFRDADVGVHIDDRHHPSRRL